MKSHQKRDKVVRSIGEYFRLQQLHGDALVIGQITPFVAGALFAAIALALTLTSISLASIGYRLPSPPRLLGLLFVYPNAAPYH